MCGQMAAVRIYLTGGHGVHLPVLFFSEPELGERVPCGETKGTRKRYCSPARLQAFAAGFKASQKCQGALFVILQRGATLNSEDYGTEAFRVAFRAPTRTISVPGTTGKSERLVGIIDVEVCVAAALGVGCVGAPP